MLPTISAAGAAFLTVLVLLPSSKTSPDSIPAWNGRTSTQELPKPIRTVEPVYPAAAQEAGVDGQVFVQVLIGKDGLIKDTKVVRSIPMLDQAAVAAARQWRFIPPLDPNGNPMAVWLELHFTFKIPAPDAAHAEFNKAVRKLRDEISDVEQRSVLPPSARDEAAREHVIRLGLRLKPPPTTLEEVRATFRDAQAQLDSATASSNQRALQGLSYALFRAPWFADAYFEAARALEAAGKPEDAAVALRLYLVADSTSSRRGEVERKLKGLGAATGH